ncbi:MAG: histidinol-phosphate transaminase [Actinomycetota bacterium]
MSQRPPLRPDLSGLEAYGSPQPDAPVRLNTNESPYPLPQAFADELSEAIRTMPLHRYPDREARELRAGLAYVSGHPLEGLWAANGSNEVIQHLCLAYGGAGRRAMVFEPTYGLHSLIPRIVGMEVIRERLGEGFRLQPEAAGGAVWRHRPHIAFVCSPNNPTGNGQLVAAVQALCESTEGLVVVDEAYGEFGGLSAQVLLERFPNLVVVRTFSKAFSLAAVRVGYCLAAPDLVEELARVRLPYHLSSLTQAAGQIALRHIGEAREVLDLIRFERDRMVSELSAMPTVEVFPSEANFALFRTTADAPVLWQALLDRGVLVRDVSGGSGLERCLRVTAGRPDETDAFLDALRDSLVEVTV